MAALNKLAQEASDFSAAGKWSEAADKYDEILALNEGIAEVHLNKGVALSQAKDLQGALAAFERATELKPELASAHANKGNIQNSQGDSAQAEASFRQAVALDKKLGSAWTSLVHVVNAQGRFTEAIELSEDGLKATGGVGTDGKPLNALHNERIFSFFNLQRPEECVDDVEAVLSVTPMESQPDQQRELYSLILSQVGSRMLQDGKAEDALGFLERGAEGDASAGNLFPYGMCLVQVGRDEEAVPVLEKTLKLNPGNWRVAVALGTLSMRKQEWEKAASLFEQGMEDSEAAKDPYVNFNYAVCLMNLGRDSDAKAPLEKVTAAEPDNAVALGLLGTVYLNDGDYESAGQVLEKADKLQDPDKVSDGSVQYNLGYAKLMADKPEEALPHFEKSVALDPDNAQAAAAVSTLSPESASQKLTKEQIEEAVRVQQAGMSSADKRRSRREIAKDVADARTPLERAQSLLQPQRPPYLRRKSMEGIQFGKVLALAQAYDEIAQENIRKRY